MDFRQLLDGKGTIVLDGAMGTELDKKGLMGRGRANLDAPQAVVEVHREYVQGGACPTTNRMPNEAVGQAPPYKCTAIWSFWKSRIWT